MQKEEDLRDRTMKFALRIVRMFSPATESNRGASTGSSFCDREHRSERTTGRPTEGRSKAEFIAKCGDCLREIEETSVLA